MQWNSKMQNGFEWDKEESADVGLNFKTVLDSQFQVNFHAV